MTFAQIISIIRARWLIVAIVLGATAASTLIISLLLPNQYLAQASVVVDVRPDPITAMGYTGNAISPVFLATQADIIRSARVAERVVSILRLNENPQIRQQWMDEAKGQGSIEQWLAGTFAKQLEVEPSRDSSVIYVRYRAPDPKFAAAVANAFVQAYLDVSIALKVGPAREYSSFFDLRAKEARNALEKAQTRLSQFQKEAGINSSDERIDIETARLNELSSQLVTLQALAAESASRQAQANAGSGDRMQEVLGSGLISSLKVDINRAEAQLQVLNSRLGENHPQVVEQKANLAEMRSKLEAETRRITSGVGITNTINRQREGEIRAALEAQRGKVMRLKAVRDEGAILLRDLENAQKSYEAVLGRRDQTSLESHTTQGNGNFLTPATPPLEVATPQPVLYTGIAFVLGGILGIGVALVLEVIDRRVRTAEDISIGIGLPLLGILPNRQRRRLIGSSRPTLAQQRMVGRLSAPAKGA